MTPRGYRAAGTISSASDPPRVPLPTRFCNPGPRCTPRHAASRNRPAESRLDSADARTRRASPRNDLESYADGPTALVNVGRPIRLALVIAALLTRDGAITHADTDTLTDVMRRAHQYVVVYEDHELSSVIGREHYDQQWLDAQAHIKTERTLTSDYLLFQLPPSEDWFALRDVYEVDGMPVVDRTSRLNDLFGRPHDVQRGLAMDIMKEAARFNLAPELYFRTLNVPTFALRYLRPSSRSRMTFAKVGEEEVESTRAWIVAWREIKGPTYVSTPAGRELHAEGRFWIAPDTGAVMRTEMIVGGTRGTSARATITVTYRHEPELGFRVPIEMLERYDDPRHRKHDVVVARATYSEFRPFDSRSLVRPHTERESR
jgi:hypothetical protein